jgi:adenosylhomocysteine nucleosidase
LRRWQLLAIVAALEAELAPLRKGLGAQVSGSGTKFRSHQAELCGGALLLAQTGIGAALTRAAVDSLLEHDELGAVLSIGFAGALRRDLRAGDLLIASQVHSVREGTEGEPLVMSDSLSCDGRLVDMAVAATQKEGLTFQVGASLTVPHIVSEPRMKSQIARRWPAAVVEMESYWVGRAAAQRGIPFLAVRAVSDALDDSLPDLRGMVDDEGVAHILRALPRLLRQPLTAPKLLRLAYNGHRAAQNLASSVEAFARSHLSNNWRES